MPNTTVLLFGSSCLRRPPTKVSSISTWPDIGPPPHLSSADASSLRSAGQMRHARVEVPPSCLSTSFAAPPGRVLVTRYIAISHLVRRVRDLRTFVPAAGYT